MWKEKFVDVNKTNSAAEQLEKNKNVEFTMKFDQLLRTKNQKLLMEGQRKPASMEIQGVMRN